MNGRSRDRIQRLVTQAGCKCCRMTCFSQFATDSAKEDLLQFLAAFWEIGKTQQDAMDNASEIGKFNCSASIQYLVRFTGSSLTLPVPTVN